LSSRAHESPITPPPITATSQLSAEVVLTSRPRSSASATAEGPNVPNRGAARRALPYFSARSRPPKRSFLITFNLNAGRLRNSRQNRPGRIPERVRGGPRTGSEGTNRPALRHERPVGITVAGADTMSENRRLRPMQPAHDEERQLSYISRSTVYAGVRRIEGTKVRGCPPGDWTGA
jgi:hypothetical protein